MAKSIKSIPIGTHVINKGTRSVYKGQTGVVTDIYFAGRTGGIDQYSVSVKYENGSESHPCRIIFPIPMSVNDELFDI